MPRWLGLNPHQRMYRSRWWDYVMLMIGLVMLTTNALSATVSSTPFAWFAAIVGFAFILFAFSDLLSDRGARRAVVALRAVALIGFVGVIVGMVLAAATGSGLAAVALMFGTACGLVVLFVRWTIGDGH